MANPPFDPSESLPSNTGVVSIFPQQERSFRDIIESWLLWEHDRSGYHAFDMDTTVNRDSDTTRPAGSIFYNTTLNVLQFCVDDDPSYIWDTISFPPGTRLLFNNTAAPTGWTKVEDAAYNDALVRIVTGTPAAPSGTHGMSEIFIEDIVFEGETENHQLTIAEMPLHGHALRTGLQVNTTDTSGGLAMSNNNAATAPAHTGEPSSTRGDQIGGTGGGDGHQHDIEMELDLHVKRVEFILCEKDAFA